MDDALLFDVFPQQLFPDSSALYRRQEDDNLCGRLDHPGPNSYE
ncbi:MULTISPECIES: hypothetical protein [unclassified Modicisalibacter]|nr:MULTISPECIES: hypothetical protein [unclassified Modicisalibacter]